MSDDNMMIDDYDAYFGGKIAQIEDAYKNGELTLDELKNELACLDDEMTDSLEDDELSVEAYAALRSEMDAITESDD